MKATFTLMLALLFKFASPQAPLLKLWDYRFGGTNYDYITSFQQTTDGGFILGGYSGSGISGDKTQPSWGNLDYWIVKIDALGIKQWDKRFGGVDDDILSTVAQTSDGGYILGGYSTSQMTGDKTEASRGYNDYWIVKTDSLGVKMWDKRYGGTEDDLLVALSPTSDKGYALAGYSGSGIGGDKSESCRGYHDYWLVKTDSMGTLQWDKTYGGSDYDFCINLLLTDDGGYLLGGASSSPAGFEKTQNMWGANDVWVVKADSLGVKQWDADYGGFDYDQLNSLCKSSGGGYLLGCYSASGISGNKTQTTWGNGDVWMVRIDNSGNLLWDRDYGASDIEDGIGSIFQDADGGYYVTCNSFSGISGDKTENNLGTAQAWILKTDSSGNKLWDKTVHTDPDQKVYPMMIQTAEGCYAMSQATYGDVAGDKSQPNRDPGLTSTDFWIIRFCDTSSATTAAFVSPNTICPGTCIDFTNLSVNATTFLWSFPGANPNMSPDANPQGICYAAPGSYDVTLVAGNAQGSDTLTMANYITVFPFPLPQGILQSGDTLIANSGASSYQWYFSGNSITGATDYYYVATRSGDYNVVATDENGCEVEAAIFNVIAGVESLVFAPFEIYPNPAGNFLTISGLKVHAMEFSVMNSLGENIIHVEADLLNDVQLDISELPAGIYQISVMAEGKIFRKSFIRE